jgi:hypothetical protein
VKIRFWKNLRNLDKVKHEMLINIGRIWQHFNVGKVIGSLKPLAELSTGVATVQCLPLLTLLSYVVEVDYFSLDVE